MYRDSSHSTRAEFPPDIEPISSAPQRAHQAWSRSGRVVSGGQGAWCCRKSRSRAPATSSLSALDWSSRLSAHDRAESARANRGLAREVDHAHPGRGGDCCGCRRDGCWRDPMVAWSDHRCVWPANAGDVGAPTFERRPVAQSARYRPMSGAAGRPDIGELASARPPNTPGAR